MTLPLPAGLLLVAAAGALVWAAVRQGRHGTVSDAPPLALALLFPLYALAAPAGLSWIGHVAVAAIVFGIGAALFSAGLADAGDVKLFAAAALWAGPFHLAALFAATGLAGGLLSGIVLARRRWAALRMARGGADRRGEVPPGRAVCPEDMAIRDRHSLAVAAGGLCPLVLHAAVGP